MKTKLVCCIAFITLTVGFSQENEDKYALTEIRSSDELEYEKFSYNLDWLLKTSDIMLDDGMRIKDSLRYNELNYIVQLDKYQLIDNEWVYVGYIEYTYDADGNRTSRSNYNSFGGSTFTLGGVYNYFYDNNLQTHWELLMGGTDLFEIGDLTYNAEGQLIQEVGQSIWGGGSPENSWMIDYEYNTDGTLNTSKHYFWNGHSWDYASGEWFDYDENKNCIKWDHKSGNTVVNRNEYAYNMDVSQENVILPINPENLNGEHLVEMENKLIQKTWSTMDNISGGLVYICDYFYEYETIPGLGIPSSEMVVDNITLFPSPANEVVTVLAKNLFINQIEVMDVSGKQVLLESNANQRQSKLNVSHLKSGVYFVRVSTNRGSVTQKLIVQ